MRATLALLLCAALLAPAVASADRAPTKRERTALTEAAARSKKTRYADCITLRRERVADGGRWAKATLQACGNPADVLGGVFRKRGGRWRLLAVGNGFIGCAEAPPTVIRDLDLGC